MFGEIADFAWDLSNCIGFGQPLFARDQMHAYAQAFAAQQVRELLERAALVASDVQEPPWHGYECPNTFQDGVSAATAAIRALAAEIQPPQKADAA